MEGYETPPTPLIAGPSRIGQIGAIAIGAYTEIVSIIAPSAAAYGDLVTVEVRVRNLYSDYLAVKVGGYLDATEIWFSPDYAWIDPGATYSFTYSFTMPNNAVTLHLWSYYWTGEEWYADDYSSVYIALAAVEEPYAGTIIGIEFEHNGTQEGLPVYNIPQGQTARVHVWGRNDMATTQRLGIHWLVYDPDGEVVEDYEDWSLLYYRQGTDHEFISERRFTLAKPGTYTVNIALSMNPSDPEIVDSYYGNLCTVAAAVPEPSFRGFGVSEYQTV